MVGTLPIMPVPEFVSGATGAAPPETGADLHAANSQRLKTPGPVCPVWSQAETVETCPVVQDSTDPDSSHLKSA